MLKLTAAFFVIGTAAFAVPTTYTYEGPDLDCDLSFDLCPYGPTTEGFTGFTFEADIPEPDYDFEFFRYQQEAYVNDNGVISRYFCDIDDCTGLQPEWLTGEDLTPFFEPPDEFTVDQHATVSLGWKGETLTSWFIDIGANGCGDTSDILITNEPFCWGRDAKTEVIGGWAYLGGIGKFNETPAPVPLPAVAWLLLGGLGALGAVSKLHRRG